MCSWRTCKQNRKWSKKIYYYIYIDGNDRQALRHDIKNDMPVVVRLARHLYMQRVEEIKSKLAQEQQEFNRLATEIHAIQSGEWDAKLKPDPAFEPVENADASSSSNAIDNQQPETTPMTEQQEESEAKENRLAAVTDVSKETDDPTLILQENRLKRTSSDANVQEPHQMKRSRLNDSHHQEDHDVLSTAVSQVPAVINEEKNVHLQQGSVVEEHTNQQPLGVIPQASESHLSPISNKIATATPEDDDLTGGGGGGSEANTPTASSKRNSEARQKAWQKNINLLWQEIANHKNGTMFMNPIKKSWAPMYDEVVKQPLYLKTIKNRVRDGVSVM